MGKHPSNTSRYFSLDFGLVHLVALDMNMYFGVDPCGEPCRKAQLAWLEEDLQMANANREAVPWVLVFSHYPLYCSGCNTKQVSAAYYASDEAELCGNGNVTAAAAFAAAQLEGGQTASISAGQSSDTMIADMQPLFEQYSVDLYLAGHWHYYESLWPITSADNFCEAGKGSPDCDRIPATRKQTTEFSYGRVIAHNRTHLTFQQLLNIDGSIFDEWTIHQPVHPFASAAGIQV